VWGGEALKTDAFTPPALVGAVPFTDLQAMIGKAETALEAFVPEETNYCAGKHLDLQIGPRQLAFTSETFILSFSLPNFHFHGVTAYNILHSRGVPLGKRDYEGRLRTIDSGRAVEQRRDETQQTAKSSPTLTEN
jgi:uncharacterized protein